MKCILACLLILSLPGLAANYPSECENVAGVELINAHKFIMLGEVHGTTEIPALFGHLACNAMATTKDKVAIMLELPDALQQDLNLYMNDKISQEKFLSHSVWSPEWQDGRFSVAMFELIKKLKFIHKTHPGKLDVILIDLLIESRNGKSKSIVLADNISHHALSSYGKILSLTGNFHNRVYPEQGSSAASLLKDLTPFTLTFYAQSGTFWGCTGQEAKDCKVTAITTKSPIQQEGVVIFQDKRPWHGEYQFKQLTFSPPASLSYPSAK
jgi:hypothetical protein